MNSFHACGCEALNPWERKPFLSHGFRVVLIELLQLTGWRNNQNIFISISYFHAVAKRTDSKGTCPFGSDLGDFVPQITTIKCIYVTDE